MKSYQLDYKMISAIRKPHPHEFTEGRNMNNKTRLSADIRADIQLEMGGSVQVDYDLGDEEVSMYTCAAEERTHDNTSLMFLSGRDAKVVGDALLSAAERMGLLRDEQPMALAHTETALLEKAAYYAYRLFLPGAMPWTLLGEPAKQMWRDAVLKDEPFQSDIFEAQCSVRRGEISNFFKGLHETA